MVFQSLSHLMDGTKGPEKCQIKSGPIICCRENSEAWDDDHISGIGEYYPNEEATLTVTPLGGYRFKQWGDGNTDNPRTILVTQDTTFTANFEPLTTYQLTWWLQP